MKNRIAFLPPVRFRVDNWRRYSPTADAGMACHSRHWCAHVYSMYDSHQGALSDSGKQVCDRLSDIFLRHSHNSLLKINIESKILANK